MTRGARSLAKVMVVLGVSAAGLAEAKGSKMIDLTPPKTPAQLVEAIRAEKDLKHAAAMGLELDTQIREKGGVLDDHAQFDAVFSAVLDAALANIAGPNDVYTWGKDDAPRGDGLCKKWVVLPGRVSANYAHKVTLTIQAKKADAKLQGKPCDTEFAAAKDDDDFHAQMAKGAWGVIPHPIIVSADGAARAGMTFLGAGRPVTFQRPVLIGFAAKTDAGWSAGVVVPQQSPKIGKQDANIFAVGANRVSKEEKKLRVLDSLEAIRGIDVNHVAFQGPESYVWKFNITASDNIAKADLPLLEPALKSDAVMVRAAAQLKKAELEESTDLDPLVETAKQLPSMAAKAEFGKMILKLLGNRFNTGADPTKEEKAQIEGLLMKGDAAIKVAGVPQIKIADDWMRASTSSTISYYLFKKGSNGWEPIAPVY